MKTTGRKKTTTKPRTRNRTKSPSSARPEAGPGSKAGQNDMARTKQELIKELNSLRREIKKLRTSNTAPSLRAAHSIHKSELFPFLDNLPFDLFALDNKGRYSMQNAQCRKKWGSFIGKRPEDIMRNKATLKLWKRNNRRAYSGETIREEVSFSVKGKKRDFYNIIAPVRRNNTVDGIVGINIDITDLKRAQDALDETERQFQSLADQLPNMIFINQGGKTVYVNSQCIKTMGYSRDEFYSPEFDFLVLIAPEFRALVQKNFKKHMAGKNIPPHEYACVTKSGKRIDTVINTRLIDYDGRRAILGIVTEISAMKKAEERLKTSETKYRDFYDNAPDMYHSLNSEGIIVDCNETEARMLGYKKAEIIGRPLTDFFTERSRQLFQKDFFRLNRKRKEVTVEREFVRRNGTKFPASLHISAEFDKKGKIIRTRTIARDISDLKKVAEELRDKERDYRIILQNVDEIVYAVDIKEGVMEGRVRFVSNKIKDILGYSPSEFIDNPELWLSVMHPDDRERIEKGTKRVPEDRKKLIRTYRLRHKISRQYRWFEDRVVPQVDERGTLVSFFGVARDITQNRIAEDALLEKERKYRSLFEESNVPIFTTTRDGTFLDINKAMLDLCGYTQQEMLGMNVVEIYADPDNLKKFNAVLEQQGIIRDYEIQLIRKDGKVLHCLLTASFRPATDRSIFGYQGIIRDITEQKKAEQERLTMQKLDSLGLLAGGIAHDFNNILTAIIGNISLAMMYASPKSELSVRLTDAEKAALRARDLTHQLLTFSKGGEPIKKAMYLDNLIREATSFSLRGSNVAYDVSIPENLWPADVDASQLSQALNNVIINAKQAMPDGGQLRISAENITITKEEGLELDSGRYVKISIKDQGSGIAAQDMERIFEPYFTTKEEGSGLGLSIAFSIISKHGGAIIPESAEGYGTNIHFCLPASESMVQKETDAGEGVITGKGTILVMDDEEMVRVVAAEILRQLGYDSEFAEDGQEAVELYEKALKKGNPYDAVILDLTIPGGMGGEEAVICIRERDPDVIAIVSSGYSNDPVMANYKEYGFTNVIAKPYKIPELSKVLNQVLTGKP